MANYNTDFLRFSAYSFKNLLTRKMSEDSKFTDQVYEGSNLAILIDLCSYLFQGLTYCINNAAAESMFSDTQIYQNISRLVKLIGYNPKGFIPSTCTFQFTAENADALAIPNYTAVDTGKFDSQGNKIYYSFYKDTTNSDNVIELVQTNKFLAYNGRWKMYNQVFTASGVKYETFVLSGVKSDSSNGKFAAHGFIDVYVQRPGQAVMKFQGLTDEIFANTIQKYETTENIDGISIFRNSDNDRYFSIRLNENKEYEIKFGNDNNGQKLVAGDKIYVFYLESNGFDAELQIGEVKGKKLSDPASLLGVTDDFLYSTIFNIQDISEVTNALSVITDVTNITASTSAKAEETVNEIRELAPDYYKLGNRLVSKSDFEYYVLNRYKENVIDVKCQNNWDYISTFFGWLYKIGKSGIRTEYDTDKKIKRRSDPRYYINQSKLLKYDYYYADPADENNVYLWLKMQSSTNEWQPILDQDLNSIKILTAEMVYVNPINVNFCICAAPIKRALEYFDNDSVFDGNNESYIEITIADNNLYSNTAIKTQINSLFNQFFKITDQHLGQIVSLNDLENAIYAINGVQRIRTVFSCDELDDNGNKKYNDKYVDGLSFATWSNEVIDVGDDLVISTTNRTLEDFQFPKLYSTTIMDKIKVIKKSFSNNSTVQY